MQPNIVWCVDEVRAVVDAKYKAHNPGQRRLPDARLLHR